ncbi:MAG: Flp pilus assembly complex ATPase component TadA, partial [Methanosphaera sp.]|nr:Flp pilus assembly complex ATPase component TadA [Methanosphaera sp.]
DVTDISYSNGGQVWLKTLSKGVFRVENTGIDNQLMEKIAFQCANAMGKTFNMANPFLDAESAELRMNFVHDSIAKNGIAVLIRKTPAKIRLQKEKIIQEDYIRLDIHDFLLKCVEGHCNILVSGETGSGKTEFVKYLAAHTKENEKLITIEDTLELHLDRIFPQRDIVAMKTNNIASYSDVLVTCMRQNPRWILLSEVRSAEAVMAVRNSISSGHNILSTIHADKASSIPSRLYSLLESNIDLEQFLRSIHRYVQIGVHIKGYYSAKYQRFHREVTEVTEFYVTDDTNEAKHNVLYKKTPDGHVSIHNPTKYLIGYLESQGVMMPQDILVKEEFHEVGSQEIEEKNSDVMKPINNSQNIISNKPQNVNSVSTGTVDNMKQVNGGQASNNVVSNQNASSIAVNNTNKSANLSTASVGMARGVNLMPNMNNNNQAFWNENSQ